MPIKNIKIICSHNGGNNLHNAQQTFSISSLRGTHFIGITLLRILKYFKPPIALCTLAILYLNTLCSDCAFRVGRFMKSKFFYMRPPDIGVTTIVVATTDTTLISSTHPSLVSYPKTI